ncbi:MAG TPA: NAD(P)/FAD-dependent oxidoreductase [Spirochaetota bacterium]|nr:NAD(P)/FAD-dependent oxidoreductase [Spirochaetota bacterium]HPV42638.1 NAD(P)/FAD-dependent oxidoreductase [Spirochaetota bacterium]
MKKLTTLFSPVTIGTMKIKNRIAMAPMATDFAEGDGTVSQRLIDYYEARARGGAGLIILEVCTIDGMSPYIPRTVGIWDDSFIPGLKRLTDAVHARGARIIPQIAHPGPESLAPLFNGTVAVGPSAGIVNNLTRMKCRELSVPEIENIIDRFGEAARRAREAGFDGLEFHAAHSYMLAGSFLSALRNRRTDAYGGDLYGRMRFPLDVIRAMREKAGRDFPVTLRLSAEEQVVGGREIRETEYIASLFAEAGVDAFHVSSGVYPDLSWRVIPPTGTPFGLNVKSAAEIRKAVSVPVMVVGRIVDPGMAEDIVRRGDADMVVLGRSLLADPAWPAKAEAGDWDDIAPCIGCGLGCVRNRESGGDMTCIVNPAVGREAEMEITRAKNKKKVLIAGGGPAGLEAARVSALAGHDVRLYEREAAPGGQFNLAAVPPGKQELCKVTQYLFRQAQKAGAVIALGTEVTPELVAEAGPDVLVVATGARPRRPAIPGADGGNVFTAHEVLAGAVDLAPGKALVIGGGMVGCETASFLANTGDNITIGRTEVTIVEMTDAVGADMFSEGRELLMEKLRRKDVRVLTGVTVKEITADGALVEGKDGEAALSGMDYIVLATGAEAADTLSSAVSGVGEVHVIGDAREPRQVLEAIREGSETGRKL